VGSVIHDEAQVMFYEWPTIAVWRRLPTCNDCAGCRLRVLYVSRKPLPWWQLWESKL